MSFENRFVVDLFVKISPFIDVAADNHVLADQPQHEESIPDLCVKLRGVRDVLRVEAKWVEQSQATNIVITKKQIRSWQAPPSSSNRTPHLWVAWRARTERYFLIPHTVMLPVLEEAMRRVGEKEEGEDRYWKIQLPGHDLSEPEFWRDFWGYVASMTGAP